MIGASKFRSWLKHPGCNGPISPAVLGWISAGTAVAGVGMSIASANEQKKTIRAQQRIADVNTARERVQAARQMRIQRAQVLAAAGNEGVGGSGVSGAVSSIGSQYGSNIGNINTMQTFGAQASAANQKAADYQAMGASFQAIGGLAKGFIKPTWPKGWEKILPPQGTK